MILPAVRDPRLVSIRRGGMLSETDHRLLAVWSAACAEHVLPLFEVSNSGDTRPRDAIKAARTWARGQAKLRATRAPGGHAVGVQPALCGARRALRRTRPVKQPALLMFLSTILVLLHTPQSGSGCSGPGKGIEAGRAERYWQRRQIPGSLYSLILEDQARRNDICWSVFND